MDILSAIQEKNRCSIQAKNSGHYDSIVAIDTLSMITIHGSFMSKHTSDSFYFLYRFLNGRTYYFEFQIFSKKSHFYVKSENHIHGKNTFDSRSTN